MLALFGLLIGTLTLGCARSPSTANDARISRVGGVTHVENAARASANGADDLPSSFALQGVFGSEGDPDAGVPGRPTSVAVDERQNVYVADSQSSRIHAFAPDGELRWVAGRAGEGPGEFSGGSMSMAWDGDSTLYVTNRSHRWVDRWSSHGEYMDSHSLEELGFSGGVLIAGFLADRKLVLAEALPGTFATRVVVVDPQDEWQRLTQFVVDPLPGTEMPAPFVGRPPIHAREETIRVGNLGAYELREYDGEGHLRRVVSRTGVPMRRPGVLEGEGSPLIVMFSQLAAPLELESGHSIAWVWWSTNVEDPDEAVRRMVAADGFEVERATSLDLFDPEGRLLGSMVETGSHIPEIGRPVLVGPDGLLYTVAMAPFPQVRSYRVRVLE